MTPPVSIFFSKAPPFVVEAEAFNSIFPANKQNQTPTTAKKGFTGYGFCYFPFYLPILIYSICLC